MRSLTPTPTLVRYFGTLQEHHTGCKSKKSNKGRDLCTAELPIVFQVPEKIETSKLATPTANTRLVALEEREEAATGPISRNYLTTRGLGHRLEACRTIFFIFPSVGCSKIYFVTFPHRGHYVILPGCDGSKHTTNPASSVIRACNRSGAHGA